jgi:hypothetical protein
VRLRIGKSGCNETTGAPSFAFFAKGGYYESQRNVPIALHSAGRTLWYPPFAKKREGEAPATSLRSLGGLKSDEAGLSGNNDRLCAMADLKFCRDMGEVSPYRKLTDLE